MLQRIVLHDRPAAPDAPVLANKHEVVIEMTGSAKNRPGRSHGPHRLLSRLAATALLRPSMACNSVLPGQVEDEACDRSDGSGGEDGGSELFRETDKFRAGGLRGENQADKAHNQAQHIGKDLGRAEAHFWREPRAYRG